MGWVRILKFNIITLFPEIFHSPFSESILKRAQEKGLIDISTHNLRDFARNKHNVVDDAPYGGGSGMLLKPDPLVASIEEIGRNPSSLVVLMTPQGRKFDQGIARELTKESCITLVCGRYEGVDERVREYVDEEISVGDYILTGGEIPAMIIVDSVSRLIPGVLGDINSFVEESFTGPMLEYPHYTRPPNFRGKCVPDILLSGNHGAIKKWRTEQAIKKTLHRRKDLLDHGSLPEEEMQIVQKMQKEKN